MSLGRNFDLEKGLRSEPEKSVTSEKKMNKQYVIAGVFSVGAILLVGVVILCGGNESAVSTTCNPNALCKHFFWSFIYIHEWECWKKIKDMEPAEWECFNSCRPEWCPQKKKDEEAETGLEIVNIGTSPNTYGDKGNQRGWTCSVVAPPLQPRVDGYVVDVEEPSNDDGESLLRAFDNRDRLDDALNSYRGDPICEESDNDRSGGGPLPESFDDWINENRSEWGPLPEGYDDWKSFWIEQIRIREEEERDFFSMGVYPDEQESSEAAIGTRSAPQLPEVKGAAENGSQPPKVETEEEGEVTAAQQADSEAAQQSVAEAAQQAVARAVKQAEAEVARRCDAVSFWRLPLAPLE